MYTRSITKIVFRKLIFFGISVGESVESGTCVPYVNWCNIECNEFLRRRQIIQISDRRFARVSSNWIGICDQSNLQKRWNTTKGPQVVRSLFLLSTNWCTNVSPSHFVEFRWIEVNFYFTFYSCLYAICSGENGHEVAEFAIQKITAEILFGQLNGCTTEGVKDVLRQAFVSVEKDHLNSIDKFLAEKTELQCQIPESMIQYDVIVCEVACERWARIQFSIVFLVHRIVTKTFSTNWWRSISTWQSDAVRWSVWFTIHRCTFVTSAIAVRCCANRTRIMCCVWIKCVSNTMYTTKTRHCDCHNWASIYKRSNRVRSKVHGALDAIRAKLATKTILICPVPPRSQCYRNQKSLVPFHWTNLVAFSFWCRVVYAKFSTTSMRPKPTTWIVNSFRWSSNNFVPNPRWVVCHKRLCIESYRCITTHSCVTVTIHRSMDAKTSHCWCGISIIQCQMPSTHNAIETIIFEEWSSIDRQRHAHRSSPHRIEAASSTQITHVPRIVHRPAVIRMRRSTGIVKFGHTLISANIMRM